MFKNTFQSGFLSILYSIGCARSATYPPRLPAAPRCSRRTGPHTRARAPPRRAVARRRSKPLQIWEKDVRNGHIKRITDNDICSSVIEIMGTNISTTYITCPEDAKQTLGIKLPFLVMIIKNVTDARAPPRVRRARSMRQRARSSLPPRAAPAARARTLLNARARAARARAPLTAQLKKYFTFEVTVLDDKNVRRRFRASNYQSTTRVKPFICTMPMRLDEGWNQIQFNLSDFTRRAYGTNYIETLRVQIHANCRIRRIYFSDRLYSEEELPPEFKLFLPIQVRAAPRRPARACRACGAACATRELSSWRALRSRFARPMPAHRSSRAQKQAGGQQLQQ